MNTNNYVEAWHRTLKDAYLGKLKRQRADVLVYILWNNVLNDIMSELVQTRLRIRAIVNNQGKVARSNAADAIRGIFFFFARLDFKFLVNKGRSVSIILFSLCFLEILQMLLQLILLSGRMKIML